MWQLRHVKESRGAAREGLCSGKEKGGMPQRRSKATGLRVRLAELRSLPLPRGTRVLQDDGEKIVVENFWK